MIMLEKGIYIFIYSHVEDRDMWYKLNAFAIHEVYIYIGEERLVFQKGYLHYTFR